MTESNPEKTRCQATRKDGQPCRSWPSGGTPYCPLHGPNASEMHRKGGRCKSLQYRAEQHMNPRLRPIVDTLGESIAAVKSGALSPSQGSAIASLASALIKAVETAEFEARLVAVEVRSRRGDDEFRD